MALLDRLSSPDIVAISTAGELPSFAAEVHLGHEDDIVESRLKHFMAQMNVGAGLMITPDAVRIYRNRYSSFSDDTVERVGKYAVPLPLSGFSRLSGPAARLDHDRFEAATRHWLMQLAARNCLRQTTDELDAALCAHVIPYLEGADYRILG